VALRLFWRSHTRGEGGGGAGRGGALLPPPPRLLHVQVVGVRGGAGAGEGLVRRVGAGSGPCDEVEFDGVRGLHPRLEGAAHPVAQVLFRVDVADLRVSVVAVVFSPQIVVDMRRKFDIRLLFLLPQPPLLAADDDECDGREEEQHEDDDHHVLQRYHDAAGQRG